MPLDINQFKSTIGDNLPSSHYEVSISPPVGGSEIIRLRTESITMPGIAFFSVDNYSPYSNGLTYNIPYRYNPQEIIMTHTVDEDGDIINLFRAWAEKIVELNEGSKFGAKYFDEYVCDCTIKIFNRQNQNTNNIKILKMFPLVVEPITLGWGQTDEIAKLNVTYRFVSFQPE